ncbi:rCG52666, isoform CRA_c [Rattus norvegicus]|uniref:RCG52666, isoform CRA_c n=1 Tax=Rattus norvegicus TaxID=10116 RepID=A6IR44_RAT|nr:rCG52666, isoform CRA_c [Rattus norvegicus]
MITNRNSKQQKPFILYTGGLNNFPGIHWLINFINLARFPTEFALYALNLKFWWSYNFGVIVFFLLQYLETF